MHSFLRIHSSWESRLWSQTEVRLLSHAQPLCDPMDYSPPGSSVYEIFQARILEWVAIPFYRGTFLTQGSNTSLCIAGRFSII